MCISAVKADGKTGWACFKPKDVLHCADTTTCLIYSDSLILNAAFGLTFDKSQGCLVFVEC